MARIQFSRRDFIAQTLKTAGVVVVSSGIAASLTACSGASIRAGLIMAWRAGTHYKTA